MRLSSRADVSAEDHRCALCRDKEEKARGRERLGEREGAREGGRDEELLAAVVRRIEKRTDVSITNKTVLLLPWETKLSL